MIKFNEIELDYEPRKKIVPKLPILYGEPEMSEFESAFLCGILKKFKPKKILEVGIAAGATTAIILQCLKYIGEKYEMHSIDASEVYHRSKVHNIDENTKSGFMAQYAKDNIFVSTPPPGYTDNKICGEHKFHLGKILPEVIEKIGGNIDLVILDTIHAIPGEILDFLAVLPYLKNDAVVVMHDISISPRFKTLPVRANAALFSAVVADKFLNFPPGYFDLIYNYPNIGAFQINEHTRENIENVFLTLSFRWGYFPIREHIRAYYDSYCKHYSSDFCEFFKQTLKMNYINVKILDVLEKFQNGELQI